MIIVAIWVTHIVILGLYLICIYRRIKKSIAGEIDKKFISLEQELPIKTGKKCPKQLTENEGYITDIIKYPKNKGNTLNQMQQEYPNKK